MSAAKHEKHELLTIENVLVKVDIWDNGDVDVYVGNACLTPANLADIVAFVELHGSVSVGGSRA